LVSGRIATLQALPFEIARDIRESYRTSLLPYELILGARSSYMPEPSTLEQIATIFGSGLSGGVSGASGFLSGYALGGGFG